MKQGKGRRSRLYSFNTPDVGKGSAGEPFERDRREKREEPSDISSYEGFLPKRAAESETSVRVGVAVDQCYMVLESRRRCCLELIKLMAVALAKVQR